MGGKIISVPLRAGSVKGDYSCADGEIESLENLMTTPGGAGDTGDAGEGDDVTQAYAVTKDYGHTVPEAPNVEFSLRRATVPGWHANAAMFPSADVACADKTSEGWARKALEMLESIRAEAAENGLFTEPFLALAALRLSDGTHLSPSPPVLMIPNSEAPLVAGSADLSADRMRMKAVMAVCRLRMRAAVPAIPGPLKGKVTYIDVFVSPPVPLYDRKAIPAGHHGISSGNFTHSQADGPEVCETLLSADAFAQAWKPSATTATVFSRTIQGIDGFHLISGIPIESVGGYGDFQDVDINACTLSAMESSASYRPDYAHLSGVKADTASFFSGRLSLCGLTMTVPASPPLSMMAANTEGCLEGGAVALATETVLMKGGTLLRSSRCAGERRETGEGCFPRWLFFPDPDARKLTITTANGSFSVSLQQHPTLHGAFFWCGGLDRKTLAGMGVRTNGTRLPDDAPESSARDSYRLPSAVWRSVKENRLLLPDSLLMNLDVGKVSALCRAFRSSGLVATTSPTAYAFTSEGVFLLRETDGGMLRDAGLIGVHRLGDPSSIRMAGRVLEFVSDRGERVYIEGSVIKTEAERRSASASGTVTVGMADGGGEGVLVTRPIKLGDAESYKRIRSVEPRGRLSSALLRLTLYGSDDLTRWHTIASSDGMIDGVWHRPVRFFRLRVAVRDGTPGSTIEALVFRLHCQAPAQGRL